MHRYRIDPAPPQQTIQQVLSLMADVGPQPAFARHDGSIVASGRVVQATADEATYRITIILIDDNTAPVYRKSMSTILNGNRKKDAVMIRKIFHQSLAAIAAVSVSMLFIQAATIPAASGAVLFGIA